jgi:type IV pilus assembly protein PilE
VKRTNPRVQSGVTLLELMAVVAIVAILSTVAVTSYRAYAQRAGRAEAKAALLQEQNNLERCFTRFSAYDDDDCAAAATLEGAGIASADGRYLITGEIEETTYELSAEPRAGGGMTDDTKCDTLTLNSNNERGIDGGTSTVAECWR